MEFGEILRDLRLEKEKTQKDVAEACALTPTCISQLETGARNPTGSTVKTLALYFGVTSDYLLGLEDDFGARGDSKAITERPPFDLSDKQLYDVGKLFKVMTEVQKARVLGYIIAFLESEGVNVAKVLGY